MDDLLAAPSAEFVARRGRIARRLREEGRAKDAAAIARLKKPPRDLRAANAFAREKGGSLGAYLDAVAAARAAQFLSLRGEAAPALATALEGERRALAALAVALRRSLPALLPDEAPDPRAVLEIVRRAAAREDAASALRAGRLLERPAEGEGDILASLASMAKPSPSRSASLDRHRRAAEREARERSRAEAKDARASLRARRAREKRAAATAAAAARAADRRARAAAKEVEKAEAAVARLSARLATAREALAGARERAALAGRDASRRRLPG